MKIIIQNRLLLRQIGLFLLYTFSITFSCGLTIIIGNAFFNKILYGTPLFWIPYTIVSLCPIISAYLTYQQFKENFAEQTFIKLIFGKKNSGKLWLILGLFLMWQLFIVWIFFGITKPI
jgi:hypothetical protein